MEDIFSLRIDDLIKESKSNDLDDLFTLRVFGEDTSLPPLGSKKNYDAMNITIPQSKEIDADVYNQALTDLQKSFKETVELMDGALDNLKGVTIRPKSLDSVQEDYTELAIQKAMYESVINGPYFEAVKADNKEEIKEIVQSLKATVLEKAAREAGGKFIKPMWIARFLLNSMSQIMQVAWNNRLWQIVGIVYCERGNIEKFMDDLNGKFADELGKYKLLNTTLIDITIADFIHKKLNYKNDLNAYLLVVDKKLPSEIKKIASASVSTDKKEKE